MPEFLQLYLNDPLHNPNFSGCDTCHMSAAGGDDRNEFGQAFEPAIIQAINEGRGHRVASVGQLMGPLPYTTYCAPASYIEKNPGIIQAGTIMTMVIPVLLFLIFQRFFVRGIVITGVEK